MLDGNLVVADAAKFEQGYGIGVGDALVVQHALAAVVDDPRAAVLFEVDVSWNAQNSSSSMEMISQTTPATTRMTMSFMTAVRRRDTRLAAPGNGRPLRLQ